MNWAGEPAGAVLRPVLCRFSSGGIVCGCAISHRASIKLDPGCGATLSSGQPGFGNPLAAAGSARLNLIGREQTLLERCVSQLFARRAPARRQICIRCAKVCAWAKAVHPPLSLLSIIILIIMISAPKFDYAFEFAGLI